MANQDKYQLWVSESGFDEEGSFCDTKSGHHYENSSAFETQKSIREAQDNGEEAIVLDTPADPTDSYGADQRFNLFRTEKDDQGTYTARKHRPGR